MIAKPWCFGSRRAVPGHSAFQNPAALVNCPECGVVVTLEKGCVPKHHRHGCLVAGCPEPQTGGGICAFHNREIVGTPS